MDGDEDFVGSVKFEEARKLKTISSAKNALGARYLSRSAASLESMAAVLDEGTAARREYDIRTELFEPAACTPYPHSEKYQKLVITGDVEVDRDVASACRDLETCMRLRSKWLAAHPDPPQDRLGSRRHSFTVLQTDGPNPVSFRRRDPLEYNVFDKGLPRSLTGEYTYAMVGGVMAVSATPRDDSSSGAKRARVFSVPPFEEFLADFLAVHKAVFNGPMSSFAYRQLEILQAKFNIHVLLNGDRETDAQKSVPHRDFYNVRKVDTHVHHSACMNQKHLLRFIKHKLRSAPNDVVIHRDGKALTLGEVFRSLQLTAYDLSIDTLDMHAHTTFERFDRFNLKYNPAGQSRLREIFLKTDNFIEGRYLAQITREVISDLEASKYQLVEWRLSVYGRSADEWTKLAKWFYANRLAHPNVRWMIQVPRLYHVYKASGEVSAFQDFLANIFAPLFAVTVDAASNPALFYFLETVVAFDSVDDESRPTYFRMSDGLCSADSWTDAQNPPYAYYMYYMYANVCALNQLRVAAGLNSFQFRPHCGEAGDLDHLASCYLLAHQINHGILLRKNPALQYLYYLSQIGIAMSPLSNNKLFLDYNKNPFPKYFYVGMCACAVHV
jgi:AMP deaminase